jgi:hypothetical protein
MSLEPLHWLQKGGIVPHCCPSIWCYVRHTTAESQPSINTTIRPSSPEAWPRVCFCTLQWPLPRLTPTPQNHVKQRRLPRRSVCDDDGPVRCPANWLTTPVPFWMRYGVRAYIVNGITRWRSKKAETDSIAAPACQELGAELKPLEI